MRTISVRFQKLNENLTKAPRGPWVTWSRANMLANWPVSAKSVEGLVQEQAALAKTIDKQQKVVRDLYRRFPVPAGSGCEVRRRDPESRSAGPVRWTGSSRGPRRERNSCGRLLRMSGCNRGVLSCLLLVFRGALGPALPGGNRSGADDHGRQLLEFSVADDGGKCFRCE